MPLPPRWALGYHQCRYSYYPESKVRFIAENFRERKIPADVIWLDIHYLDGYNPFTWDTRALSRSRRGSIADLRREGFRTVVIVDPHPKKEPGWGPYDTGLAGDHFVKNPDGTVYEAPVWPSKAETEPGPERLPRLQQARGARVVGRAVRSRCLDVGVAGHLERHERARGLRRRRRAPCR